MKHCIKHCIENCIWHNIKHYIQYYINPYMRHCIKHGMKHYMTWRHITTRTYYIHVVVCRYYKHPDGSFTVPWFLKNVVLVLAKRTFWVQKSFLKKVHRKMLSSTLPAFCGQKRSEFGFPFFSSQLCQVEARFGQQVSYLYIYKCIISIYMCPYVYMNIHITYSDRNIGVCIHM